MSQSQENFQTERRKDGKTEGWKDGRMDGPAPILPATARGPKSDSNELRQQPKHLRNMEISGASTIESISERTIN